MQNDNNEIVYKSTLLNPKNIKHDDFDLVEGIGYLIGAGFMLLAPVVAIIWIICLFV